MVVDGGILKDRYWHEKCYSRVATTAQGHVYRFFSTRACVQCNRSIIEHNYYILVPVFYNQPAVFGNATVEDVNKFNSLPFYLVRNEVKQFPIWSVFDQLYGEIDWQANEGNTMKGVTPQRSPVSRSFFFPNAITQVPNKDVYTVTESVEQTQLYMHDYESFQFNFLPSFVVFWKNYLQFANADIVRQIAVSNNQFIETNMYYNSPYYYIAGVGLQYGAPTTMGNDAGTAAGSKTAQWLVGVTNGQGGVSGINVNGLRLRDVFNAFMNLQEDLAAPAFGGSKNMPKDNDGLKEKYVVLLSSEDFLNFTFDPDVINKLQGLAPCDLNLLFNDFKGLLFGFLTCKINKYPIRYNTIDITTPDGLTVIYKAGTPIAPEIFDATDNKWKPNPYYTSRISAPYTISWILGADRAKTVKVGPPPKEFAAVNMSAKKFYSMRWNGEVQLTDQVLIFDANNVPSLNVYGKQLKFISELTHGYLEGERRYAFPIFSKRTRPANVA